MADKKKMSVAEMLAAARKSDSSDSAESESEPAPSEPAAAEPAAKPQAAKPGPKVGGDGGRMSVADMLAAARGEQKAGAVEKPTPKAAKPVKKAAPAAAAKSSPKPSKKAPAAKAPSGPRDTASILASVRKETKPGPMSKSEAAAQKAVAPKPEKEKKAIELPPMPLRPAYAQADRTGAPARKKIGAAAVKGGGDRRGFLWIGFAALAVVSGLWGLLTARFMFPNVLREPPSRFKVGFPSDFPRGSVSAKFKAQFAIWVVNTEYNGEPQIAALSTVCTHLGCTPNWLEAEQKYKCPCHGSGFYKEGINFEGPAPRPLERYAIRIADDGQIEVDKSRKFQEEMGQWTDSASYIPV